MKVATILKRFGAVCASLVMAASTMLTAAPVAVAAPGDSTGDPIIITDCLQLQAIDENTSNYSKHYALGNDIDCTVSIGWNSGKGFDPIASEVNPFTGTFNGRHHTITNLTINRADDTPGDPTEDDESSIGLFAWTQDTAISNLNIDTSKVKGYAFVGGIVGWAEDTTLTNVSFNATVEDNSCDPGYCVWARYGHAGGGLVGVLHNSSIVNGVTGGPAKGSGNTIGGLVGQMGNNSSITSSSSSSNIDGGNNLGGAVGWMMGGNLVDVHASGSIDANNDEDLKNGYAAGGLVGLMDGSANVTRSSATGSVHADHAAAGGLVGNKQGAGSISDSYARGNVTQADGYGTGGRVGGLIGELTGGSVARTYASGSVSGDYSVGGLIGQAYEAIDGDNSIQDSFAAGLVTATDPDEVSPEVYNGGLIGSFTNGQDLGNNYYDADRTGMDHCYAWYPEGYAESDATIAGECVAVNVDEAPNATYFYNASNQPFNDGETQVWSAEIWDFHEDDYPTFTCDQCEVIEDGEESDPAATLETLGAEDITATTAVMHGEAQLHNGVTIENLESNLMVGFHLNTNSTVDWDNFVHSAPVEDVSAIEGDDTHLAFSGLIDGLECETQYWYVAAYIYGEYEDGVAGNVETFTTDTCPAPDDDNDGISNDVEDGAPLEGDGNNDGVADSEQANVASFVSSVTNKYVTVVVNEQCELSAVSASQEEENWVKDPGFAYSSGFVHFTADCGEEGFTTAVTLYQYGVSKADAIVRKYNPITKTYATITNASLTEETIDNQAVAVTSYQVTDGGELDVDGEENGVIVDPVGFATPAASATTNTAEDLASTGQSTSLLYIAASMLLLVSAGAFLKLKRTRA